jgi:hypothetical protein
MYNRFLAQFGGRNHHPMMLSISPILPQLLTIMSDTQEFPFFSKDNLLWMLTCHGATLHIVRALCGPTPNRRIMHLILGRIVSRIASNPMVVSCFEKCSIALQTYPVSIPRSLIHVEISDKDIVFNLKTIWQMLWLCTVLPEAKAAILDISSADLSPVQMKTYNNLYTIIIFRRLFESRNRVFILLCKYFHSIKQYEEQRRFYGCIDTLQKRIKEKLRLQMKSHDFKVYSYYLKFLFTKLHPCELSVNLIDDSFKILDKFFKTMKVVHRSYEKGSVSDFFGREVNTSNFSGISDLLNQEDQKTLLEQLKKDPIHQKRESLMVCMSPQVHSFHEWLFPVLQRANLLILPARLQEYLEDIISNMETRISYENKLKNQFARMISLVFTFAKWSQSDHPHRHFIFECVSSMKATGTMKHADLARFLHLQSLQSKSSREFEKLFKKFRKFAHPSMEWSEPTERTLLCFFDKMHVVLSNKEFLSSLQKFLKTLENEQFFWKKVGKFESLCHSFLTSLYTNPQFHSMIEGICYFRLTNCEDCRKYLHSDNDDGLCPSCKHQRVNDKELEEYEEEERDFFARGPRRWE